MQSIYQPHIVRLYGAMGSRLPLDVWVNVIAKNIPAFRSDSQIYKPISIRIKMTPSVTDPEGVVKIDVSPTDTQWYSRLVEAVGEMFGQPDLPLDIINYDGRSLEGLKYKELYDSGDCKVINKETGKAIFLEKAVAPPKIMSTNKHVAILDWFDGVAGKLCELAVKNLEGQNLYTLKTALGKKGPVVKNIASYLQSSYPEGMTWEKFLQTYARDDEVREISARNIAEQIGRSVVTEIRKSLRANGESINIYFANKEGEDDEEEIFQERHIKSKIANKHVYHSDKELFEDIVDCAIEQPNLKDKMYYIINAGQNLLSTSRFRKVEKLIPAIYSRPKAATAQIATTVDKTHPVTYYFQNHHYKEYGNLPHHFIESMTSPESNYPGDPSRVLDAFHLFAGYHTMPPVEKQMPGLIPFRRKPKLVPIESKMPGLIPFRRKPKLVPIESEMPKLEAHDFGNDKMPRLVSRRPPLEKISRVGEEAHDEMPPLVLRRPPLEKNSRLGEEAHNDLFADEIELENDDDIFIDDFPPF